MLKKLKSLNKYFKLKEQSQNFNKNSELSLINSMNKNIDDIHEKVK